MTTDRVTARREVAAERLHASINLGGTIGSCLRCESDADRILAAVDEWDRANSYVTVRLGDLERAWSEGYQDGWSDRAHPGEDLTRNPYRVLRESAEGEVQS